MSRWLLRITAVVCVLFSTVGLPLADRAEELKKGDVLEGNTSIEAENFVIRLPSGSEWRLKRLRPKGDGGIERGFVRTDSGRYASTLISLESYPISPAERTKFFSLREEVCARPTRQRTQIQECERYFLRFVLASVFKTQKEGDSKNTRLKFTKYEETESPHPECISWYAEAEDKQVPWLPGALFIQSTRAIFCITDDFERKALIVYSYRAPAADRDHWRFISESNMLSNSLELRRAGADPGS